LITKNEFFEQVDSKGHPMKVRIELFAAFREAAGYAHVTLEFEQAPDIATLKCRLGSMWPDLAELLSKSRIAVNNQFQDDHHVIESGHEIALIPPVSGG
jgi:molybdopterin converting factor subunit 1